MTQIEDLQASRVQNQLKMTPPKVHDELRHEHKATTRTCQAAASTNLEGSKGKWRSVPLRS